MRSPLDDANVFHMDALPRLRDGIEAVWLAPPDDGVTPSRSAGFKALEAAFRPLVEGSSESVRFALDNAIRWLGAPWASVGKVRPLAFPPDKAALLLLDALRARTGRRRHLCPLDWAGEIPDWQFGMNQVRQFSADELNKLVGTPRLLRHLASWEFDSRTFANFRWLVVEEDIELDPSPGLRAWPFLATRISDTPDPVCPHSTALPMAVEKALFSMLLMPWEDVMELREVEWRPFQIPWIYTVDDDPFTSPKRPPDPQSLSFEEIDEEDEQGNRYEQFHIHKWPIGHLEGYAHFVLGDDEWQRIEAALSSSIFETPISHFFVRAFMEEGIDEFLAHLVCVEAALGRRQDFDQRVSWKFKDRASALLPTETDIAGTIKRLHEDRSAFVHGRKMQPVARSQLMDARRVARLVVNALVRKAASVQDRDFFLDQLA